MSVLLVCNVAILFVPSEMKGTTQEKRKTAFNKFVSSTRVRERD